jgi:hypothetical protein
MITVRYKAFEAPWRNPFKGLITRRGEEPDRPLPCEGLVHRGVRPPEPMKAAYPTLPGKEDTLDLQRRHDDVDASSGPGGATVYEDRLFPPRPGWYLVAVDADGQGGLDDGVCINATSPPSELWVDFAISGGPLAFAKHGSRAQVYLRPRVGWTRYFHGGWLGAGVALGYGFTDYAGTRADWTDLDVAVEPHQRWQRHAMLLSPYLETRSRATVLPVEFRARLGPAFNGGLVALGGVSDDLTDFRAGHEEDTILDLDVDIDLDLSVGAPLGPVQLDVLMMLVYAAVDDAFARSATNVIEDANLYLGFGFMISGGRR